MSGAERSLRVATTNQLRANARRIALRATLVALVGGVLICAVADVLAAHRVSHAEDAALNARVATLVGEYSKSLAPFVKAHRHEAPGVDAPDFDASTFLEWFVPTGGSVLALERRHPTPATTRRRNLPAANEVPRGSLLPRRRGRDAARTAHRG